MIQMKLAVPVGIWQINDTISIGSVRLAGGDLVKRPAPATLDDHVLNLVLADAID